MKDLIILQNTMLDLLNSTSDPVKISQTLNQLELNSEYRCWLQSIQPEMLEVAADLVKKWSKPMPVTANTN